MIATGKTSVDKISGFLMDLSTVYNLYVLCCNKLTFNEEITQSLVF